MFEHVRTSRVASVRRTLPERCSRRRGAEGELGSVRQVVSRFPAAELAIHRLYAQDADFRGLCDDYGEALSALRHWEGTDEAKAGDFRRLTSELEVEIAAVLGRGGGWCRRPG